MKNNRILIVTDHDADLIEVHPPSRGAVDLSGVTIERCPPGSGTAGTDGRNGDRAGDDLDAGVPVEPRSPGTGFE
jgi:hypothetical protein